MTRHTHVGAAFDDFLREHGPLDDVDAAAIKRVLAWQLREEMARQRISKLEMARRMRTSRSQLGRAQGGLSREARARHVPFA